MFKKTTNIAVIVSGIDEEYQNNILKGIRQCALENSYNVSYFIAFGGVLQSYKHDHGEFNIFNLPNFSRFDGAILLTNTIASDSVREHVFSEIKKANIPVVSIDNDIPEMYYIGIDNKLAMKKIAEHLIIYHGFSDFKYISGPLNNTDSMKRLEGFLEAIEEHNIPFNKDNDVMVGDFTAKYGKAVAETIVNSKHIPQAIVCANDAMALGLLYALESRGVSCPEQVCISGFDNIYTARNYYPELTSVERSLYHTGYLACEKLFKDFNGVAQPRAEIIPTRVVFATSCGCHNKLPNNIAEFKRKNIRVIEEYQAGIPLINRMSSDLTEAETLEDNLERLKKYITEIKCEQFYLCMCEHWIEAYDVRGDYRSKNIRNGYTKYVTVPLAYHDGSFGYYENFESSVMLPELSKSTPNPNNYFFVPIHFQDLCLGYCVICNCEFPIKNPMFHTWVLNISTSLQNIRNKICLEVMIKRLDKLYVIDQLTNIYNRFGFSRYSKEPFRECVEKKYNAMILFIDLDGLKEINDRFGHTEGDNAIINVAQALKYACHDNEIYARFGGDEFIAFAGNCSESHAKGICERIQQYLDDYNNCYQKPYKIQASIGYHIVVPDEDSSIFDLISIADNIMYEIKKKKKKNVR